MELEAALALFARVGDLVAALIFHEARAASPQLAQYHRYRSVLIRAALNVLDKAGWVPVRWPRPRGALMAAADGATCPSALAWYPVLITKRSFGWAPTGSLLVTGDTVLLTLPSRTVSVAVQNGELQVQHRRHHAGLRAVVSSPLVPSSASETSKELWYLSDGAFVAPGLYPATDAGGWALRVDGIKVQLGAEEWLAKTAPRGVKVSHADVVRTWSAIYRKSAWAWTRRARLGSTGAILAAAWRKERLVPVGAVSVVAA
ncbi:MAG: hypothetical protein ACPGUV_08330 [Polyangiales bacterium]